MTVCNQALAVFAVNRMQERRESKSVSCPLPLKKGFGFCETCKSNKPAPANRKKGWKCNDCKSTGTQQHGQENN